MSRFVKDFAESGKSLTRASLDKLGSEGFRSERLADGSLLRTHGGMPRTYPGPVTQQPGCTYYLESGQLDVVAYAPQSPNRYDAGYWSIPGVDPTSSWLGAVLGDGAQVADQALSTEQRSQALAAEHGHVDGEPGANSSWNTALRKKKLCVNWTPPSCYTGRMRLFVQALYGAKFNGFWDFEPVKAQEGSDVEAFVPGLKYKGQLTLGISTPTPVLFFDKSDCTFWLLVVGGAVTVYPLKLTPCGEKLLASYKELYLGTPGSPSDAVRNRMEAYILAEAEIDLENSFSFGSLPGVSPFAYGWKANWCGTELSIVSHPTEEYGSTVYDVRYVGTRLKAVITRDSASTAKEKFRWSVSCTQEEAVKWVTIPGKNIWAPLYWVEYLLMLQTLGRWVTQFSFQDAPIYCYYDKDDNLQVARFTSSADSNPQTTTYDSRKAGNLFWSSDYNYTAGSGNSTASSASMSIGGDTLALNGSSFSGTRVEAKSQMGAPSGWYTADYDHVNPVVGGVYGAIGPNPGQGALDACDSRADPAPGMDTPPKAATYNTTGTYSSKSGSWASIPLGAMIIPMDDCEAVYLKKVQTDTYTGSTTNAELDLPYKSFDIWGCVTDHANPPTFTYVNYGRVDRYGPIGLANAVTSSESTSSSSHDKVGKNKFGNIAALDTYPGSLLDVSFSYPFSSALHSTKTSASGLVTGTDISGSSGCTNSKTFSGGI